MKLKEVNLKKEEDKQRLDHIFKVQKDAFANDPYPSASVRKERMSRFPEMLKKYRYDIHEVLVEDFGGHATQASDLVEIITILERAAFNIAHVSQWMKPKKASANILTHGNATIFTRSEPKGVIGNMVPWNFPFDIGLGPTLDAICAGNRVIIKPSELVPRSGKLLEKMIGEFFSEDEIAVCNGGIELSKHFTTKKWDHLVFTGSGKVGKMVMKAAAENLVPVTLELGGKSPVILHESAINKESIENIASIKIIKRGQMCVTGDYILVPEKKLSEVVQGIKEFYQKLALQKVLSSHSCGIISDRHRERLRTQVNDAKEKGGQIIEVDTCDETKFPFYLIVNATDEMLVMQEEIFGPIYPIITYKSTDDIINYINNHDNPLGLYIYARDKTFVKKIVKYTQSGGVAINVIGIQAGVPSLPFGGSGASGIGVHHGESGFQELSNPRGYYVKRGGGLLPHLAPPYTKKTDDVIKAAYGSVSEQLLFAFKKMPGNLWSIFKERF